jgi:hypothetical protein
MVVRGDAVPNCVTKELAAPEKVNTGFVVDAVVR